jgi:hypothetical protein
MVHDMVAAHAGQVLGESVEGQDTTVPVPLLRTADAYPSRLSRCKTGRGCSRLGPNVGTLARLTLLHAG